MPLYESVFIARQDVAPNQVEQLTAQFADVIKAQGGTIAKTEQWGLRNLAYKINKNRKGHYVLFNLEATPPAIAEMERQMRLHEDVLRFMTVRVEALEAGPSPILRKVERDERDFGDSMPPRDREARGERTPSGRVRRSRTDGEEE